MIDRRVLRRRVLASSAVLLVLAACNSVKVTSPDEPTEDVEPSVFIPPCSLLTKQEMEAAVGVPLEEPEWFLGGPPGVNDSCMAQHARSARVSIVLDDFPHEGNNPPHELDEDGEPVPELGEFAVYSFSPPNAGEVHAYAGGVRFGVVVSKAGMDPAAIRAQATDLARKMSTRIVERLPGNPSDIPQATRAPIDVCEVITGMQQLAVLGWTSRKVEGGQRPEESLGGPWGGTWTCWKRSADFVRSLTVAITRSAVPPERAAQYGTPTQALRRPHTYVFDYPLPADVAGFRFLRAGVAFPHVDGRVIVIELDDPGWDATRHRRTLLELARIAIANLDEG